MHGFASLHGLPVALPPRPRPVHFANRALVTSFTSSSRISGGLPSVARRRALRSGCDSLGATLRPPLHFPRSPTADRSCRKSDVVSRSSVRYAHPHDAGIEKALGRVIKAHRERLSWTQNVSLALPTLISEPCNRPNQARVSAKMDWELSSLRCIQFG